MRKILMLFLVIVLCVSCDIYKKSSKTKSDSDFSEQIETKTYRKGDTVHYDIPKVSFKDTTIIRRNEQGTVLRLVYDSNGQTQSADCFSSLIEEYRNENRNLIESLKEKNSEKKEEMNTTWISYGFIAIAVIICFALLLGYFYIQKNTAFVSSALENISKKI